MEPGEGGTPPTTTPLAPTTTTPISTPPTTPPTTDPTTPPTTGPVEHQGTWENKDEDGDGVPDEQDDYPFDADKTRFDLILEQEPNDNPSNATQVTRSPPFRVSGGISKKSDNGDLFSFEAKEGEFYTLILSYSDSNFNPNIYFSEASGNALNFGKINIDKTLKLLAVNVGILASGKHHVGINDINFDGKESFTYKAAVFLDMDGDALEDMLESAMGINNLTHDSDHDGIWDTEEFYYGVQNPVKFDADTDGIPNWQDPDSDGTGILDHEK